MVGIEHERAKPAGVSLAQLGPALLRIQTGNFVIEFTKTIDNGNHIHGVIRDLDYDFGHGLLAHHFAQERARGHSLSRRRISSAPHADHDDPDHSDPGDSSPA